MKRAIFEPDHKDYRETVRRFVAEEVVPNHERWEEEGVVPRELFAKAADKGMLAMGVPEAYGGLGVDDFRFNQIVLEEVGYAGVAGSGLGITLHNDVCMPYFLEYCSDEQRERWLPGIADGSLITALAMTEPGIGSDLASLAATARPRQRPLRRQRREDLHHERHQRRPDHHGGQDRSFRTPPRDLADHHRARHGGLRARPQPRQARYARAGHGRAVLQRTCQVPVENRLGDEGKGFLYLVSNLAQERMSIAIAAVSSAQAAFDITLEYVKERTAFGQPVGSFQASRFALAEMKTEIELATVYVDQARDGAERR